MKAKLWIATIPRTGSTFLAHLLNLVGNQPIKMTGDPDQDKFIFAEHQFKYDMPSFDPWHTKAMYEPVLSKMEGPPDHKLLLLTRRDLIGHATSLYLSNHTGVNACHSDAELEKYRAATVPWNELDGISCVAQVCSWTVTIRQWIGRANCLPIFTEDLMRDPEYIIRMIYAFMDEPLTWNGDYSTLSIRRLQHPKADAIRRGIMRALGVDGLNNLVNDTANTR